MLQAMQASAKRSLSRASNLLRNELNVLNFSGSTCLLRAANDLHLSHPIAEVTEITSPRSPNHSHRRRKYLRLGQCVCNSDRRREVLLRHPSAREGVLSLHCEV